ncbi:MAG: hypothetical protein NZ585_08545 [Chloracidobacterium sp.]|nr:hypothetical protein [Chloracidobacterium sp.]MDW8217352.1 hypothetical protein [Acidobacteriota bacterium]
MKRLFAQRLQKPRRVKCRLLSPVCSRLPAALNAVFAKVLALNPEQRYATRRFFPKSSSEAETTQGIVSADTWQLAADNRRGNSPAVIKLVEWLAG